MTFLLYLLLFSLFVFPQLGIVSTILPYPRLIAVVIVIFGMISKLNKKSRINFNPLLKKIFISWALLITYIFFIDLIQNDSIDAVNKFMIRLLVLLLFIVITDYRVNLKININSIKFNNYLILLFLFVLLLGTIQIFNPSFTYNNLIPATLLTVNGATEATRDYLEIQGRVIGPFQISISYSLVLGFIFIYILSKYLQKKKLDYIIIMLLTLLVTFFTFTRSLTFGLLPIIFISYWILSKKKTKNFIYAFMLLFAFVFVFQFYLVNKIEKYNRRAGEILEGNTGIKLISNTFGVVGSLSLSPIIGVPIKDNVKVIREGTSILSIPELSNFPIVDTNHNQIGWMIKYYGLIGLILFVFYYLATFKYIWNIKDPNWRFFFFTYFLFFFQFSMLHNSFMFMDFYFWVFLGLYNNNSNNTLKK